MLEELVAQPYYIYVKGCNKIYLNYSTNYLTGISPLLYRVEKERHSYELWNGLRYFIVVLPVPSI